MCPRLDNGDDDNDDDDESIGYVRPLLQLKTVTSVLMIRSDEEFGFQMSICYSSTIFTTNNN